MRAVSSISLHPLNASKHYVLARSTEIKTNLDGPSPRVAISFRAGPRIWTCEWPPTEKTPLESVLHYRVMMSQSRGSQKRRTWTGLCMTRYYRRLGGIPKGAFLARAGLRKVFDICGKFSDSSGKIWFPHMGTHVVCIAFLKKFFSLI